MDSKARSARAKHLKLILDKYREDRRSVSLMAIRSMDVPSDTKRDMAWRAMMIVDLLLELEGRVP